MSTKSYKIGWAGPRSVSERLAHGHSYESLHSGADVFYARLSGFHEVPPVLTDARGTFTARVSEDETTIEYELTYENLSTPAVAAHLHFGQPGVNGAIFSFLCGGNDKGDCPGTGGAMTGTIQAEDIIEVPAQGLASGDMAGALRIIRSGLAYVNVHSTAFPSGEIRGQVHS